MTSLSQEVTNQDGLQILFLSLISDSNFSNLILFEKRLNFNKKRELFGSPLPVKRVKTVTID